MTTEQLERKLEKIIIDLKDFADEVYLDRDAKEKVEDTIKDLERICRYEVYSTDL